MVFYRKYRPQKIEELDSERIRERLFSVLRGETIPHAFLFTGPRGLGKTSAARILAKAINCRRRSKIKGQRSKPKCKTQNLNNEDAKRVQDSEETEPCNVCDQCVSITNGNNLDVFEIDAASNRGIDEIRDIKEKLRLAPQAGILKKVYIIDEVHMLTQEAFNALLKTLEEPPSHVLFILCTTEPSKIPQTIVSRCFHVVFRQASKEELMRSFERIVKGESINVDQDTLYYVADLAEGGFRDGAKILEELVQIFGRKKITKEAVEEKYHLVNSTSYASELIEAMQARDAGRALKVISCIEEEGLEVKRIIADVLTILHESLLVFAGVSDSKSKLKLELSEISQMASLFINAYSQLKYAVLSQLPLEIAVVEYTSKLSSPNQSSFNSTFLPKLIEKTKVHNHSLSGLLRGCGVVNFDKDKLVLGTKFKFHKQRLEERENLELLEKVCAELTGNKIKILIELKS